jgi:glycogen debranching enzyme
LVESGLADKDVALSLLSSAVDNLNKGCLCHISENADGDSPHAQKGCTAQAWSDSEFLRVWLKLTKDKSFSSVASNQA